MNLIFLPTEYPTKDNQLGGIFVKDQVYAISKKNDVTIFYNYFFPLRKINFNNFLKFFYKNFFFKKNKILHFYTFFISPYFDRVKIFLDFYFTKKKLENYIKLKGKPDLLICHFSYPVANTAMLLSKQFNIPYVVVEHSTGYFRKLFNDFKIKKIKKSLNNANLVVAVSNFLKKKLKNIGVKSNIKVIGNIIDHKIFYPNEKQNKSNILKLIIVCELVKKKVIELIKLLKDLMQISNKFHLNIIGDGPERKFLENFVIKKIKKFITFRGILNKNKISKLMNESDYLISVSKIETFGITIAEAISSGLPAVIDSGGPNDFINRRIHIK